MAVLVSTDDLKQSLRDYTVRGDMRWLKRDDAPELIRQVMGDQIEDSVIDVLRETVGGLSAEELEQVLAEI